MVRKLRAGKRWCELIFKRMVEPGRYRHYKGSEYQVIGIARHSETHAPMVVYRPDHAALCAPWLNAYCNAQMIVPLL